MKRYPIVGKEVNTKEGKARGSEGLGIEAWIYISRETKSKSKEIVKRV